MAENLQELVDGFATRFDRSVAVDDASMNLLAYSAHQQGAVDEARTTSIMQRAASKEAIAYSVGLGAMEAVDLFLDPPCPEIGQTITRIAMPIRYQNQPLGFIWLMETEGAVTPELHAALTEMADEAALMLHRGHALTAMRRDRESEYCKRLISNDAQIRKDAAREICEERILDPGKPVIAFYLYPTGYAPGEETDQDRLAIAASLDAGRSFAARRKSVAMTTAHHGLFLVSWRDGSGDALLRKIGQGVHESAVRLSGRSATDWWIGVGRPVDMDCVPITYLDARRTALVASALKTLGQVVTIDALGIYGLLSEVPEDKLRLAMDARYLLLAADKGHDDVLIETLETYLDNAGSVQKTSKIMYIERASLYYRLRRIQEIADVDLSDGNDRLSMHQSLKVARLLGLR